MGDRIKCPFVVREDLKFRVFRYDNGKETPNDVRRNVKILDKKEILLKHRNFKLWNCDLYIESAIVDILLCRMLDGAHCRAYRIRKISGLKAERSFDSMAEKQPSPEKCYGRLVVYDEDVEERLKLYLIDRWAETVDEIDLHDWVLEPPLIIYDLFCLLEPILCDYQISMF